MLRMKSKLIKSKLNLVIQDWISSLDDTDLQTSINTQGAFIAGGALASLFLEEDPKDYDIYLPSIELRNKVMEYYCDDNDVDTFTNNKGETSLLHPDGYHLFPNAVKGSPQVQAITKNAITLANGKQIIVRYYGLPTQVLKEFDFAHTKNAYCYPSGDLILKSEALECLLTKELRYVETKYPVAAFVRSQKFIHRGFTMGMADTFKMIAQINGLDLTNKEILQDQLLGVSATVAVKFVDKIQILTNALGENPFKSETAKDNYEVLAETIDSFFENVQDLAL